MYGYPARILDFESGKYRAVFRVFGIDKRLYQLGFISVRDDFTPADANEFLNSFRLR